MAGDINPSATYYMGELALNKDKKFFSTRDIGQLIALTVVIFLLLKVFFRSRICTNRQHGTDHKRKIGGNWMAA